MFVNYIFHGKKKKLLTKKIIMQKHLFTKLFYLDLLKKTDKNSPTFGLYFFLL